MRSNPIPPRLDFKTVTNRWAFSFLATHDFNPFIASRARPRQRWLIFFSLGDTPSEFTAMKLATPFGLALLWLVSSTAQARLDETRDQCEERYGKATVENAEGVTFAKNPIHIHIRFERGKAVRLEYLDDLMRPFSEENLTALLKANGSGAEWKILKARGSKRLYLCPQKRYYAYYDGPPEGIGILFLFTADEFEREMASAPQEKGMMADLRKLYKASDDETMNESLKGF